MNAGQPVLKAIVISICCGVLYLTATEMYGLQASWVPLLLGLLIGGVFYRFATSAAYEPGIRWQHGAMASGIVAAFLLAQQLSQASLKPSIDEQAFETTPENAVIALATDLAIGERNQGKQVNWPPGVVMEHASQQEDFPPEIWEEAQLAWEHMSPEEKKQFQTQRRALVTGYHQLEKPSKVRELFLSLGFGLLSMSIAFVPASRLILLPSGD